jgi:hypothetical protein
MAKYYARPDTNRDLTEEQVEEIVTFLKSLTRVIPKEVLEIHLLPSTLSSTDN